MATIASRPQNRLSRLESDVGPRPAATFVAATFMIFLAMGRAICGRVSRAASFKLYFALVVLAGIALAYRGFARAFAKKYLGAATELRIEIGPTIFLNLTCTLEFFTGTSPRDIIGFAGGSKSSPAGLVCWPALSRKKEQNIVAGHLSVILLGHGRWL